jgi:hypothetical protein
MTYNRRYHSKVDAKPTEEGIIEENDTNTHTICTKRIGGLVIYII